MLFVSRYRAYTVIIREGAVAYRTMANGTTQQEVIEKQLVADFNEDGYLSPRERLAAKKKLEAFGEGAFGALPHTESGVLSSGEAFSPSDVAYRVSTFRTDNLPDDERPIYEAALLSSEKGYGSDYVLVEAGGIEKPWPSYDSTHHNKIAPTVSELGLDAALVAEYERLTKNRPGVVEALEALEKRQAEDAFEKRPLEVSL